MFSQAIDPAQFLNVKILVVANVSQQRIESIQHDSRGPQRLRSRRGTFFRCRLSRHSLSTDRRSSNLLTPTAGPKDAHPLSS
jgi:hypothetical protein